MSELRNLFDEVCIRQEIEKKPEREFAYEVWRESRAALLADRPDVAGLVERLTRQGDRCQSGVDIDDAGVFDESAAAILAQQAQIADVKAKLKAAEGKATIPDAAHPYMEWE